MKCATHAQAVASGTSVVIESECWFSSMMTLVVLKNSQNKTLCKSIYVGDEEN